MTAPRPFPFRTAHLEALAAAQREALEAAVAEKLEREYFGLSSRDTFFECLEDARLCCASAARFGITDPRDVTVFADFFLYYGPEFPDTDTTRWAKLILESQALSPAEKLRLVLTREPL
jgi:hypothetical protein